MTTTIDGEVYTSTGQRCFNTNLELGNDVEVAVVNGYIFRWSWFPVPSLWMMLSISMAVLEKGQLRRDHMLRVRAAFANGETADWRLSLDSKAMLQQRATIYVRPS